MFDLHAGPLKQFNLYGHRKGKLFIALGSLTAADFKEFAKVNICKW